MIIQLNRFNYISHLWLTCFALISIFNLGTVTARDSVDWLAQEQTCKDRLFPLTVGGSLDDFVNCTIYDDVNEQLIVAGVSSSIDFIPTENPHGFAYAIDTFGNWKWGKFFYNVGSPLETITGCKFDDDHNLLFYGRCENKPVILRINPDKSDEPQDFAILERPETETEYDTFQAFYYEKSDPSDGLPYYYMSFVANKTDVFISKIRATDFQVTHSIKHAAVRDKLRPTQDIQVPKFLVQDPGDDNYLILIGQFRFKGTILRIKKRDLSLMNHYEIRLENQYKYVIEGNDTHHNSDLTKQLRVTVPLQGIAGAETLYYDEKLPSAQYGSYMHEITSIAIPKGSANIILCGYGYSDPATFIEPDAYFNQELVRVLGHKATIMMISSDGEVQWKVQLGEGQNYFDKCQSVSYDERNRKISAILEVNSPSLRSQSYSDQSRAGRDILVVTLSLAGRVQDGFNINHDQKNQDFPDPLNETQRIYKPDLWYVSSHASVFKDGVHFFGAQTHGYKTKFHEQDTLYELGSLIDLFNAHLIKFDTNSPPNCLFNYKLSSRDLEVSLKMDQGEEIVYSDNSFRFSQANSMFIATQQQTKMIGAFDLMSSSKYPKLCSLESVHLPEANYFLYSYPIKYNVGTESDSQGTVNLMKDEQWIYANGTSVVGTLGQYNGNGDISLWTEDETLKGTHTTYIRGCSSQGELLELSLKVNVKKNTKPKFKGKLTKDFKINAPGDTLRYTLPEPQDAQQNSAINLFIQESQELEFPPYYDFDNTTRTLIFRTHSVWHQGRKYGFEIVLDEEDSSLREVFECTVKIRGDIVDPQEYLNFTDIKFELKHINGEGKGFLSFSHPVNMEYLKTNWDQMFEVYRQNSSFVIHEQNSTIKNFEFTEYSDDQTMISFNFTVEDPQFVGMLTQRKDRLYIRMKETLLDINGQIPDELAQHRELISNYPNASLVRFFHDKCLEDADLDKTAEGGPANYASRMNIFSFRDMPQQFVVENAVAKFYRSVRDQFPRLMVYYVIFQFVCLKLRGMTNVTTYLMVEALQLYSVIAFFNFNFLPYMYDFFMSLQLSFNMMISTEIKLKFLEEYSQYYYNEQKQKFRLSTGHLLQAVVVSILVLIIIMIVHGFLLTVSFSIPPNQEKVRAILQKILVQFRFNIYLQFYKLIYFNLTYFALIKIKEADQDKDGFDIAMTLLSVVIMVSSILIPAFIQTVIYNRFKLIDLKECRKSFDVLITKFDKKYLSNMYLPGLYFFKRFVFAWSLLVEPGTLIGAFAFFFIMYTQCSYGAYVWGHEIYQSRTIQYTALAYEFGYVFTLIMLPIFSDYEQNDWKKEIVSHAFVAGIFLSIYINMLTFAYLMFRGPKNFKKDRLETVLAKLNLKIVREEWEKAEELRELAQQQAEEGDRDEYEDLLIAGDYSMFGVDFPQDESTQISTKWDDSDDESKDWEMHGVYEKDHTAREYSVFTGLELKMQQQIDYQKMIIEQEMEQDDYEDQDDFVQSKPKDQLLAVHGDNSKDKRKKAKKGKKVIADVEDFDAFHNNQNTPNDDHYKEKKRKDKKDKKAKKRKHQDDDQLMEVGEFNSAKYREAHPVEATGKKEKKDKKDKKRKRKHQDKDELIDIIDQRATVFENITKDKSSKSKSKNKQESVQKKSDKLTQRRKGSKNKAGGSGRSNPEDGPPEGPELQVNQSLEIAEEEQEGKTPPTTSTDKKQTTSDETPNPPSSIDESDKKKDKSAKKKSKKSKSSALVENDALQSFKDLKEESKHKKSSKDRSESRRSEDQDADRKKSKKSKKDKKSKSSKKDHQEDNFSDYGDDQSLI